MSYPPRRGYGTERQSLKLRSEALTLRAGTWFDREHLYVFRRRKTHVSWGALPAAAFARAARYLRCCGSFHGRVDDVSQRAHQCKRRLDLWLTGSLRQPSQLVACAVLRHERQCESHADQGTCAVWHPLGDAESPSSICTGCSRPARMAMLRHCRNGANSQWHRNRRAHEFDRVLLSDGVSRQAPTACSRRRRGYDPVRHPAGASCSRRTSRHRSLAWHALHRTGGAPAPSRGHVGGALATE
jgi:hypothetical protein